METASSILFSFLWNINQYKSNLLIDSEKGYSLKTKTFYKMHMWYVRESLKRLTYLSGCNWKYMPKLYMACLKSYYTGIVSSHSSCHSLEIVFYSSSGKYTRKENREKNSNKSCNKAPPPPPDSHTATYTHVTFQCNFFCIRLFSWSIKSN